MKLEENKQKQEQDKSVIVLKQKLEELNRLINKKAYLDRFHYSYYFKKWLSETEYELRDIFGEKSIELKNFTSAAIIPKGKYTVVQADDARIRAMLRTKAELEASISVLEKSTKSGKQSGTNIPSSKRDEKEPIKLFNMMKFHPLITEVSRSLFETEHYASAIFEAFKAVNKFVKEKSNMTTIDGRDLMSKAFRKEAPVIRLNELKTSSDLDEQEGFMVLFMGAMVGIRNPKAHDNVSQTDPYRTLEYLSLASLLLRRAEEGTTGKL
jgi:uncharacterized protein (TIGR02391 family)